MKPIAFLLAGHSNWGKSRTLRSLTDERYFRYFDIAGTGFFVRRMSNDDFEQHYRNFIDSCVADASSNLIAAFCPNFTIPGRFSAYCLEQLSSRYRLHIFVLRHRYMSEEVITDAEIQTMTQYGEVRIFDERNRDSVRRATAFEEFITEVLRR